MAVSRGAARGWGKTSRRPGRPRPGAVATEFRELEMGLSPRADATATRGTAARIAPADIAAVVVSPRAEKRGNALSRRSEDASSRVRRTTVRAPVITHGVHVSHQTDAKIRCPIRCELETETESRQPKPIQNVFAIETENRNRKLATETETDSKFFCNRNRNRFKFLYLANPLYIWFFENRNRKFLQPKPTERFFATESGNRKLATETETDSNIFAIETDKSLDTEKTTFGL